jgi:bifunctional DNA-binding transcriptional regulator/antitoxin component of YhaV-PrlF toxin-antitoxin module
MALDHARMQALSRDYTTKSDKIRALSKQGYSRSEIAKFLQVRYQFVRNVLVATDERGDEESRKTVPAQGIRNRARLKLEAGGRVVIPSPLRQAMGLEEGTTVLAWVEDGELRLVSPKVAMRQAQELAQRAVAGGASLADELLAERREEAKRENGNG